MAAVSGVSFPNMRRSIKAVNPPTILRKTALLFSFQNSEPTTEGETESIKLKRPKSINKMSADRIASKEARRVTPMKDNFICLAIMSIFDFVLR